MSEEKERRLGIWDKYLTLWVAVCIGAGIGLGKAFPGISEVLSDLTVANVSIPVAVCLFLMIYPIMVQIDSRMLDSSRPPCWSICTCPPSYFRTWTSSESPFTTMLAL